MSLRRLASTLILMCYVSNFLFGQSDAIKFERISTEHGLPHSGVTNIVQDHQGYMWFGTWDGIARYDGYEFVTYKYDPSDSLSLSHNMALRLYVDREGYLWVGTMGGGLNRFNPRTEVFTRYQHLPDDHSSLSHDFINAILEDRFGTLWIGTWGGGLNALDLGTDTFTHFVHDPEDPNSITNDEVWSIEEDPLSDGSILWVGTSRGLNRLNVRTRQFSRIENDPLSKQPHLTNFFTAIEVSRSGNVWLGTEGGLYYYLQEDDVFLKFVHDPHDPQTLSSNSIKSLGEDRSGALWIGTVDGMLHRLSAGDQPGEGQSLSKPKMERFRNNPSNPRSLSTNRWVEEIYEDRAGSIWIATDLGGLNRIDPGTEKFVHFAHDPASSTSLSHNHIWTIIEDRDDPGRTFWIGTGVGGLNKLDRLTGRFTRYLHDPENPTSIGSNAVISLYEDEGGGEDIIWVGTLWGGLNKFNKKTEEFERYLPGESIISIFEDRTGTLWLGTWGRGLIRFDRETGRYERFTQERPGIPLFGNNTVMTIFQGKNDADSEIWIGTQGGGISRFNTLQERFTQFVHDGPDLKSLSNNDVWTVYEDRSGRLWIGTSGGLNRFIRADQTFEHYMEEDGLTSNHTLSILEDDSGNLWIGTMNGLSRFDPGQESFLTFTADDGLQGNTFLRGCVRSKKTGEMLFGGTNGLSCFYPQKVERNQYVPPVVITQFSKFNRPARLDTSISYKRTIVVPYHEDILSFRFAALNYINPHQNRYAYKLEGFDEDWVDAGTRREATYTNLDPGAYTFRVKASNNDGIWNEEGTWVRLIITPPFWQTWWFRVTSVLAVIGLLGVVYRSRVRYLEEERAAQEEVSRKLIETQESERQRIAAELHDGLGQDLLIINNELQQGMPTRGKSKRKLEHVSSLVLDTLNDVREIASNLHPHQLDRLGLKKGIESDIEKVKESTGIGFRCQIHGLDDVLPQETEIHLYRIIQEGVNNIVRHSDATEAFVELLREEGALVLVIEDNGKGFDVDAFERTGPKDRGFGLSGMRQRVSMIGGKLDIVSDRKSGTRIMVRVPMD